MEPTNPSVHILQESDLVVLSVARWEVLSAVGGVVVSLAAFFLISLFENLSQAGFNKVHGVTSAFVDEQMGH